jgi:hypothetical protein
MQEFDDLWAQSWASSRGANFQRSFLLEYLTVSGDSRVDYYILSTVDLISGLYFVIAIPNCYEKW